MTKLLWSAALFVSILWMSEKYMVVATNKFLPLQDVLLVLCTAVLMHAPSDNPTCAAPNSNDMLWATCVLLVSEFTKFICHWNTDCWSVAIINAHIFAVIAHEQYYSDQGEDQLCNFVCGAFACLFFALAILKSWAHVKPPAAKSTTEHLFY